MARIRNQNSVPAATMITSDADRPPRRSTRDQQREARDDDRRAPSSAWKPSTAQYARAPHERSAATNMIAAKTSPPARRAGCSDVPAGDAEDDVGEADQGGDDRGDGDRGRSLSGRQRLELPRASAVVCACRGHRSRAPGGSPRTTPRPRPAPSRLEFAAGIAADAPLGEPLTASLPQRAPPAVRAARAPRPRGRAASVIARTTTALVAPRLDRRRQRLRRRARRSRTTACPPCAPRSSTYSSPAAGRPGLVGVACTGPTAR